MKRKSLLFLLIILQLGFRLSARAQDAAAVPQENSDRYHIAVFLPLFLDSAFDGAGRYRFADQFPKYLNPGLEFYEGLRLAMDSLEKAGVPVEITVHDTRSAKKPVARLLADPAFDSVKMIFALTDGNELRVLAHAASEHSIPLIM